MTGGYQITISLSPDVSFGVISRMPDDERCTIPSCDLPFLFDDLRCFPRSETLHKWFERKRGARP